MAGAKLQVYLPVSIAFNGIGLNMTGFSYNGVLWVCFVACRDMLPDPSFFSQCLKESFDEILEVAQKLPRVAAESTKAPVGKARAKARPAAKTVTNAVAKPATKRTRKPVEATTSEAASLANEVSTT
jgi:hypothetical protein